MSLAELLEPRRMKREEYERMVELGLLQDQHVELIRGVIVTMSPIYPSHASPVDRLMETLVPALLGRARVRIQHPLVAADESEPEPDVAVVPLGDYSKSHPDHAQLVIEVADSSLRKARLLKGPLYAESGFREYWIVNVQTKEVEVHRGPTGDGWKSITRHGIDETLSIEAFPDVTVRIGDIFG